MIIESNKRIFYRIHDNSMSHSDFNARNKAIKRIFLSRYILNNYDDIKIMQCVIYFEEC